MHIKGNSMKIDSKDKQLLDLLYLDSRSSCTQLGKKLKLSSSTVERRLTRLIKEEVITLLFADVDFAKLGLKSYRLYIKLDVLDQKIEQEFLKFFIDYKKTVWGVICQGDYDILLRFIAKDEFEVQSVIELVLSKFGNRVIDKTVITTTYQNYLSWNHIFQTPRRPAFPIERMDSLSKFDEIDKKILSLLYANSRLSTVEISRKVDLSPDAVQYRLRRLKNDGFILGYTAWFDCRKLGFNYYKLLIGFRNITSEIEDKFIKYCSEQDFVVFINKTIGSWDIELDVVVTDIVELHSFIRDLKTRFGQIIAKQYSISAIDERMLNPLR